MSEASAPPPSAPSPASTAQATPANGQPLSQQKAANEAPPTSGEARPGETPAQTAKRLHRLQVGDQVEEVDDAGYVDRLREVYGDEGLVNIGQLSRAARKKLAEAAHREKQLMEAAQDLGDPKRLFSLLRKQHGEQKARAMMEEMYALDLEERQMDPVEREKRQAKAELEALKAERQKILEEQQKQQRMQATQQAQQAIGRAFAEALRGAGLEGTPYQLARMAAHAEAAMADGLPPNPQELAREVAQEYDSGEVGTYIRKLSPDRIAKLLGVEGMRALRRWDAQQVSSKRASNGQFAQKAPAPSSKPQANGKRIHVDDFFANLGKR